MLYIQAFMLWHVCRGVHCAVECMCAVEFMHVVECMCAVDCMHVVEYMCTMECMCAMECMHVVGCMWRSKSNMLCSLLFLFLYTHSGD